MIIKKNSFHDGPTFFWLLTLTVDVTNFHKSLVEARLPNSYKPFVEARLPNSHDSFVVASPWRSLVPRTAPQSVKTQKRLPSKKLTKTHGGLGGFLVGTKKKGGWNFWSLNWIQQTWISKGGGGRGRAWHRVFMSLERTERKSWDILPKEKVASFPGRYFIWCKNYIHP